MELGVFGGTFDPPHYGHLALAETARVQLGLDEVIFVPAGAPPHKLDHRLSPPEVRAALVEAAIADNPAFTLCRVDLDRPGPHYTVEMLRLLRHRFPQVERWYFLMGEDSLRDFPTWREPARILEMATLAVMPRPQMAADVEAVLARLPALRGRFLWLDVPPVYFAATDLRRRVRVGLPLRYLVPPAVEQQIAERQLYREPYPD